MNIDAERSSETLVTYHITTRSYNPEDRDLNLKRPENLKSLNGNKLCKMILGT
jgi:hypothetical protein